VDVRPAETRAASVLPIDRGRQYLFDSLKSAALYSLTILVIVKGESTMARLLAGSAVLVLVVCGCCLYAQTDTASLSGVVTDPSGAVVVNAEVSVTKGDTNISQVTRTNSAGLYSFPSLPPANYRVSVKAAGFKEAVEPHLTLHVRDTVSLNIKLEVGTAWSLPVS